MMRASILCCACVLVSCADPEPIVAPAPSPISVVPPEPKIEAKQVTKPLVVKKEVVEEVPAPEVVPASPAVKKGEITSVDLPRLFDMRVNDSCLLIDVRPGLIHSIGHISGSISLPKKSFEAKYPKVKPQIDAALAAKQTVVLYCADVNCPDGYAVGKLLAEKGYSTSIYKGGWDEWKAAGVE